MYKLSNEEAKKLVGSISPNNIDAFRILRADLFLSMLNLKDVSDQEFVSNYLKYSVNGVLINEVHETLRNISNTKMVAATNGTTYPRKNKLMSSEIAQYFDAFYSAEDLGASKPDPIFFSKILDLMRCSKDRALVVGDKWDTDICGAKSAGIDCCWFNRNSRPVPSSSILCDYEIARFGELREIIEGDCREKSNKL